MKSKSFVLSGLFLAVCLLFSACYASVTRDKPIGDTDKAERVLIYTVDRADSFKTPQEAELPEPYILPKAQYEAFFDVLHSMSYTNSILYVPTDPDLSFYGYVVKIEYRDGAEEWLCGTHMTQYRDADGQVKSDHYSPDSGDWDEAILPFLPQKGA